MNVPTVVRGRADAAVELGRAYHAALVAGRVDDMETLHQAIVELVGRHLPEPVRDGMVGRVLA